MVKNIHKDLVYFGNEFRRLREEHNYSLQDIEVATSLRLHHIRAIEEGNIGELISPVYARGFITNYAEFLGLNIEELFRQYPYVGGVFSSAKVGLSEAFLDLRSVDMRSFQSKEFKLFPFTLKLLFWGAIIGAVWLVAYFCRLI